MRKDLLSRLNDVEWTSLPAQKPSIKQRLFYKFIILPDGYLFMLTNLYDCWVDILEKEDLTNRAKNVKYDLVPCDTHQRQILVCFLAEMFNMEKGVVFTNKELDDKISLKVSRKFGGKTLDWKFDCRNAYSLLNGPEEQRLFFHEAILKTFIATITWEHKRANLLEKKLMAIIQICAKQLRTR
ncbi:hypothetical protein BDF19DRAFT_164266 [Syncephalis fuscata]|nr:hypothetical protein BDF19DRAFT_164266 [Syncephalis fuscata]